MTSTTTRTPKRQYRSYWVSWALTAVAALLVTLIFTTNKAFAFQQASPSLPPPRVPGRGGFRSVRGSLGTTATPFLPLLRSPSYSSTSCFRTTPLPPQLLLQYMNRDDLHDNVAIEETLLRVHVTQIPYADFNANQIQELLLQYIRSFPFAAVLPVQPLTYLPAKDGVDVQFLRKKTPDKPSIDGGIRIRVERDDRNDHNNDNHDDHDHDDSSDASTTPKATTTWTITATRNSEGQSIVKTFAEKRVVSEFLDGLTGKSLQFAAPASRSSTNAQVQPREVVEVTSVYHKWITERR